MNKLMTGGKLARILGVNPATIAAWADSGRIPSVRPGSWRRFDLRSAFRAALDARKAERRSRVEARRARKETPKAAKVPDGLVSMAELAARLGKAEITIRSWLTKGIITSVCIGSRFYFDPENVRAAIESRNAEKAAFKAAREAERIARAAEPRPSRKSPAGMLSVAELAARLKVSRQSVYCRINKGIIPSRYIGNTTYLDWDEVQAALDDRRAGKAEKRAEPPTGAAGEMLSVAELAARLGRPVRTIHDWKGRGIIPFTRVGTRIYFDLSRVQAALDARGAERAARRKERFVSAEAYAAWRAAQPETRGRKADADKVPFNQALNRIMNGNLSIGDCVASMSVLTGLDYAEIRRRIDMVEYEYSDIEKTGRADDELISAELKTLVSRYSRSKDPAVQAWVAAIRRPARPTGKEKSARVIDQLLGV